MVVDTPFLQPRGELRFLWMAQTANAESHKHSICCCCCCRCCWYLTKQPIELISVCALRGIAICAAEWKIKPAESYVGTVLCMPVRLTLRYRHHTATCSIRCGLKHLLLLKRCSWNCTFYFIEMCFVWDLIFYVSDGNVLVCMAAFRFALCTVVMWYEASYYFIIVIWLETGRSNVWRWPYRRWTGDNG